MDWKKLGKVILFPHIAIMIILIPIATVFLVCSMVFFGTKSIISIVSYVLAAYTLAVWCFKIPHLIKLFKKFKKQNKYVRIWQEDTRLRINISLYGNLIWNTAYALLQLGMGFYHRSFWFSSLAAYYFSLAVMRFFLVNYTNKYKLREKMILELRKYRTCGIAFLVINLALTLMVFFMVYWNRSFYHHEITTITLATYTFITMTFAVINIIKYRKYDSPVYSASKAINLASACVSMLTLESTMLTTFGKDTMSLTGKRILLGISGGTISIFIIFMAIYMIVQGNRKLKILNEAKE